MRDGFFDDDGVGRNDLRQFMRDPARVDRFALEMTILS
jgi:hypothetical protein